MNLAHANLFEEIYEIAPKWLKQKGVEKDFLVTVLELARDHSPFYKILLLWSEASIKERKEIVADLEDMMEDYQQRPSGSVELPLASLEKAEEIAEEVKKYKVFLKNKIKIHGGVSRVAKACRMSQPSLSRFLSSASMPRKSTLEKLAKVLGLTQKEISFAWVK